MFHPPDLARGGALEAAALAAVLLVAAGVVTVLLRRRRRSQWGRWAARHRLDFEPGPPPAVRGRISGRFIRLEVSRHGSDQGELGVEEVRLTVELRAPLPPGVEITELPGLPGELVRARQDDAVESGDEGFDQRAILTARDAEAALGWLTQPRREAIVRLIENCGPALVSLEGAELRLEEREMLTDLERLEELLATALGAARELEHG